jgi:hypothetical protein
VVLCKSRVIERVQDSSGVVNTAGKQNGGEGGKMGYIYPSCCDFLVQLVLLVNEQKTAQPSSCRTTRHLINEEPRNEISYSRSGQYATLGITFAFRTTFTAQTSCISEQTEYFSGCPNCASIQHGDQPLAVEKAHATDVIG